MPLLFALAKLLDCVTTGSKLILLALISILWFAKGGRLGNHAYNGVFCYAFFHRAD